jgi:hypothetical protein
MHVSNSMRSARLSTCARARSVARLDHPVLGPSLSRHLKKRTRPNFTSLIGRISHFTFFWKVPDKLRRKVGEDACRGVLVGYPIDAPMYRVHNPVTRCITSPVHVMIHYNVPRFRISVETDSLISNGSDARCRSDYPRPPCHGYSR